MARFGGPAVSALLIVVGLALSGCLASDPGRTQEPAASLPSSPIAGLSVKGPGMLVSPEGHRMAEFMVARSPLDPDHLVIGVMDYDSGTGTVACVTYVTRDGGATWSESLKVPGLDRSHLQFDAWLSFDANGTLHYVCLDTAGPTLQTWPFYSYSTDGGRSWAEAVRIPTEVEDQSIDKSSILAARDGTVYVAFSGQVARTQDRGQTWQRGAATEAGSAPNGFVEDAQGTVFLQLIGGGSDGRTSRVARSSDGGDSWNVTHVGPFLIPPGYNDQTRWVDQRPWTTLPSLAMSPLTDHLFVAQQSWDAASETYLLHVYRSVDGGVTFEERSVPAVEGKACRPCHATKPSIVVDDAGRLGLLVQLVDTGGHTKEVWFSASGNEAGSWVEPVMLSATALPDGWTNANAFTPPPAALVGFGQNLAGDPTDAQAMLVGLALSTAVAELQMRWNGEYWGLGASTKGFVVPWIDHANEGVPQLYAGLVRADPDPGR